MAAHSPVSLGFDPARLAAIKDAIQADVDALKYDGVAMIVARRGEIVFQENIGFADRAAGRPVAADDVFFTMSVAKQFTNTAVLQAVEKGRLALTSRVVDVIPEFGVHGKDRITVADLIIHKAGLSAGFPNVPPDQVGDLAAVAAAVAAMPPEAEPGTCINYSPVCAHAILAEMVRRVDGGNRPFRRILADDVFEPLGMNDTALGARRDLAGRQVPVVVRDRTPGMFDPDAIEAMPMLVGEEGEIPAGGCLTTASDVLRFAEAMRLGGSLDGHRVLSPAMVKVATTNQTGDMPNLLWRYAKEKAGWPDIPAFLGMGFFLRGTGVFPMPFGNLASPGTFGGLGAGSNMFWVDPVSEVSCVFLSAGLLEEIANVARLQRISDMVHAAIVH
jgi:CubicO group peptidase (beta-lactamase class C family)